MAFLNKVSISVSLSREKVRKTMQRHKMRGFKVLSSDDSNC